MTTLHHFKLGSSRNKEGWRHWLNYCLVILVDGNHYTLIPLLNIYYSDTFQQPTIFPNMSHIINQSVTT